MARGDDLLVPPLLTAVREVRARTLAGLSTGDAFRIYLEDHHDELSAQFRERWVIKARAGKTVHHLKALRSPYARAFWELIERGIAGEPISAPLASLEDEIENAAQAELDQFVSTLPFKVLLPLLAFQFPAHLVLLMGPTLRELSHQLGA